MLHKQLPDEKWMDDVATMTWRNYFASIYAASLIMLGLGPNVVSIALLAMCILINYRIRWFNLMMTFPPFSKIVTLYVMPLYPLAALIGWKLGFVQTAKESWTFGHLALFVMLMLMPPGVSGFELRRVYPVERKQSL